MIALVAVFMIIFSGLSYGQVFSDYPAILEALQKADYKRCLQFKVSDPCLLGDVPGAWISYWEPSFVIRTFQKTSGYEAMSSSNLQFHEVHRYDFPLKLLGQVVLCSSLPDLTGGAPYISENDKDRWRVPSGEAHGDIGKWGKLYPRSGYVVHYSAAVASALDAVRAVSFKLSINRALNRIQMIEPKQNMCMSPGLDPQLWDHQALAEDGKYLWVYWRFRKCCKPLTLISAPS